MSLYMFFSITEKSIILLLRTYLAQSEVVSGSVIICFMKTEEIVDNRNLWKKVIKYLSKTT